MKRLFASMLMGLALVMGTTTCVFAQAQSPQITPNTPTGRSIAMTLQVYLNAFNVGDLPKAYSMFADIKQNTSLKQFEAQGDPQKGWNPVLTRVHVIEEQNIAQVYIAATIHPPKQSGSHNIIFVYPMVKPNGTWKLVSDESDFGHQKYLIFQKLGKEIEAYAEKQHVSLN
jgi:hypothetical protein